MPELQAMEEIKRTAVHLFFQGLAESREAVYQKIIPIARKVRDCYADAGALAGITDDEFATMMLVDGCFLVQFIYAAITITIDTREETASLLRSIIHPHFRGIMRDIMLLENQIPWPVIEFLMSLRHLPMGKFIGIMASRLHGGVSKETFGVDIDESYKPSHLLCFIRFYTAGRGRVVRGAPRYSGDTLSFSTSAAELAEMGIKLKASKTAHFSDMNMVKGPFFAKLSLPPLHLDIINACWLVNMAAFEMCTEAYWADECFVNSYLRVLSQLMNRKDDVRELRVKRIVGGSSDKQTLELFVGLAPNLSEGLAYFRIIIGLENYKHKRRVWISIYRFLYNNAKTIATVLSAIGVLVGIFRALYSLKEH
uniref:Uncharacterized protein n=1 Tax=Arundo donax TaxID=35708 RepID=A0A0A8ZAY5_ARUDO